MDKTIKITAITQMAKPKGKMAEAPAKDMEEETMDHECVCSCCGAPCPTCAEAENEDSSEDSSEDMAEGEED